MSDTLTFDDLPALAKSSVPEHSAVYDPALSLLKETVPGGLHWFGLIRRGNTLRMTALGDTANVSALFYNFEDRVERYNMPDYAQAAGNVPHQGRTSSATPTWGACSARSPSRPAPGMTRWEE